MTKFFGFTATLAFAGICSAAYAHGVGGTSMPGATYTVPRGTISGPVVINNPTFPVPTTSVVNNGTIHGGASPGITVTGPTPTTVTNNGAITSTTKGITVTGDTSSRIVNTGTISVQSTGTSSASATGVSQGN